jgi:hypothetical protein
MLRKAKRWAKQTGYDIDDFLLAVVGGDNEKIGADPIALKDRIACAKLWKEYTMARVSEQNVTVSEYPGPVIGLPERRPDPALAVVKGGKHKEGSNG